jgi:LAO/AO transport system kinase
MTLTLKPPENDSSNLVTQALSGNRRALARLLTWVEDGCAEGQAALAQLFPHTGQAHIVGITGSPGSGKSTLINSLVRVLRENNTQLAIVAVDPTSPFSGGALLGDRLRMRDLLTDPGVFIRSMASRGHPGGVAHATRGIISVLDAAGFPVIFVETVGTGQAQVEVARVAHTVVLVEAPGMGDDIQALKAGMMEIADIIVVNKADKPEAQRTVQALKSVQMLHVARDVGKTRSTLNGTDAAQITWDIPVLQTNALDGQGVAELLETISNHRRYLFDSGYWEELRERHIRAEVEAWLQRHFQNWLAKKLDSQALEAAVTKVLHRQEDPAAAARGLLTTILGEYNTNI